MKNYEIATLSGGCFWCMEAIFKRLKGVVSIVSGYAGGEMKNPSYEEVSSGKTGYTETIQITFNPEIISYKKLLDVFWQVIDPTTLNRQGSDIGTQYRSAIFYHSLEQKKVAEASRKNLEKSGKYREPIVTKIEPFKNFYRAEAYHQNYYENRGDAPYCRLVIDPKIQKLMREFKEEVKEI